MKNSGRFDWFELMTKDTNKAKVFYSELFHWKTESHPVKKSDGSSYDYTVFNANGKPVAGLSLPDHDSLNNYWLAYTTVPNLDEAVKNLQKNGGKILVAEEKIPDIGRWVIALDAQGMVFSPFEPRQEASTKKPDMSTDHFCWHELSTSNPEQAVTFYSNIFAWQKGELIKPPDGSQYQVLNQAGEKDGFGGVFTADAKSKATWRHYVAVDNVDETLKRANSLGGKTLWPAINIGENGRIACFTDNQGAEIAVWAKE